MAGAIPLPRTTEPSELRKHVFREVRARVELYCIGEIQNQPPEAAREYLKAWQAFKVLWGLMEQVDPKDVKDRVGRRILGE
jgi:hypothetical protein